MENIVLRGYRKNLVDNALPKWEALPLGYESF